MVIVPLVHRDLHAYMHAMHGFEASLVTLHCIARSLIERCTSPQSAQPCVLTVLGSLCQPVNLLLVLLQQR